MAYRILTTAALLVALVAPAVADEIRPNGPPIVIKTGAATLIQSSAPFGTVFVANSAVAEVHLPTQGGRDLIYVTGKTVGKTSLYVLGDDGQVVLTRMVEVSGPKTVRVFRANNKVEIWSEAHGEPTTAAAPASGPAELPPNTTTFIAVGSMPTTK